MIPICPDCVRDVLLAVKQVRTHFGIAFGMAKARQRNKMFSPVPDAFQITNQALLIKGFGCFSLVHPPSLLIPAGIPGCRANSGIH